MFQLLLTLSNKIPQGSLLYGLCRLWLIDDDTDEVIFLYIKLSSNVVRTTKVCHAAQDLDIIISLKSHSQKDAHKAINETAVF